MRVAQLGFQVSGTTIAQRPDLGTLICTNRHSSISKNKPFPFELFCGVKVNKVANFLFADSHVVEPLSLVLGIESYDSLQLDNDFIKDEQVGTVDGRQDLIFEVTSRSDLL